MPLSKIFDLHVITTGFVFFLLGLIVFPYINQEMVKKFSKSTWLGIVAPVIGISTMTFASVLVLLAKGHPDNFVLDYFFTYLAICLFSLSGYVWHIISIDENDKEFLENTLDKPTSTEKKEQVSNSSRVTDQVKILNGDK